MNWDDLDLIKIDVEGAELEVLFGAERVIRQHKPYIIFEYTKDRWLKGGHDLSSVEDYLKNTDYSLFKISRKGLQNKDFSLRELSSKSRDAIKSAEFLAVPKTERDRVGEII